MLAALQHQLSLGGAAQPLQGIRLFVEPLRPAMQTRSASTTTPGDAGDRTVSSPRTRSLGCDTTLSPGPSPASCLRSARRNCGPVPARCACCLPRDTPAQAVRAQQLRQLARIACVALVARLQQGVL